MNKHLTTTQTTPATDSNQTKIEQGDTVQWTNPFIPSLHQTGKTILWDEDGQLWIVKEKTLAGTIYRKKSTDLKRLTDEA